MKDSDKRAKIMQTALELFAEQGFHGVPMTKIAEKAKVAAGTIYLYFASKDILIQELFMDIEENILTALREGHPVKSPIRERYFHFIRGLIGYFIARPLHFRYIEQYMNSPYGITLRRDELLEKTHRQNPLDLLFAEGITRRIIKDVPVIVLFSVGIGPIIMLVRDHTLGFVELNNSIIEQIAGACWDGIRKS